MSRKPKKGYFVRGQFVAEGSELDLQLKAELKHFQENSRTELKRESEGLQKLGEQLMTLRAELFDRLQLPEKLVDALAEAKRITNFEGKRRQMQFVGKLMRQLDEDKIAEVRAALDEQQHGSAQDALALHEAEAWRDRLVDNDEAMKNWLAEHPDTDAQQLRALVRQARKERQPTTAEVSEGQAPRRGRAYREIFQLVKEQLQPKENEDE
jgi:ribosome-associated protein